VGCTTLSYSACLGLGLDLGLGLGLGLDLGLGSDLGLGLGLLAQHIIRSCGSEVDSIVRAADKPCHVCLVGPIVWCAT
jgi:hypothetical protein